MKMYNKQANIYGPESSAKNGFKDPVASNGVILGGFEDMSTMNTTIKTRDSVTFRSAGGDSETTDHSEDTEKSDAHDTRKSDMHGATQTTATQYTNRTLDLRTNDNQFHVIASLIVDKFEKVLTSGVESFLLTPGDRLQLDRLVPVRVRQNFVEAVNLRLKSCPPQITRPIHVVLRKCEALGLDRNGPQNLLFAPEGTIIYVHVSSFPTYIGC